MIMKNLKIAFFLMLMCIGFNTVSKAQVSLGIKAGAGLADVHLESTILDIFGVSDVFSSSTVFHGGLVAEVPLADQFQLTGEVLYSQKGFTALDNIFGSQSIKATGHYLSIPVMIFYKPIDRVAIGGGAEIGYLLDANTNIAGADIDINSLWNNDFELGLNLGAKVDLTDNIWLEGRYNFGLSALADTQINDIFGIPIGTNGKLTNRVASVSLGYRF